MASALEISAYYSRFAFRIDNKSVTNLYAKIKQIKEHISKQLSIQVKISKFTIDKRALNLAVKEAAKNIGGVKLSINSFAVNATELRRAVQAAYGAGVTLNVRATTRTNSGGGRGSGNSYDRADRILGRNGLQAVAGYATGLGVMNINRISEDIQSSKTSLNTITDGRGVDAFQWIKDQGNALGFDYRSQLPIFSNYLGASINKQGYEKSLESFRNLAMYGQTHGADRLSMERAMLAIGQMWSKGNINAEELNTQLAEAKGFSGAKSIIAEAYQQSIGGKLTGQEAEAALIEAMKKGLVKAAEVLPIMTEKMGIKAAGGIDAYLRTTPAQHARFTNAITNSVEVFGKGGFDEGMMRFFKFMADFLDRHSEDIRNLGKSFLALEHVFEALVISGEKVAELFNSMNQYILPLLTILLPLTKIIGKTNLLIVGLGLVLYDIGYYFDGKDSVTGNILKWFKGLEDMSWGGIASGIALVGSAMAAAFLPIRTLALGIAALVAAYQYLKSLDNRAGVIDPTAPSVPTWDQLDNQNAKSGWVGKYQTLTGGVKFHGAREISQALMPDGLLVQDKYKAVTQKIQNAWNTGRIGKDERDRALYALIEGQSSPESMGKWIDTAINEYGKRQQTPVKVPQIIELNINGDFRNDMVRVMLDGANSHFVDKQSQPKQEGKDK